MELVILLTIVVFVASQCPSSKDAFEDFLLCTKAGLDEHYDELETELKEHSHKAIETCFAQGLVVGNSKERCVLALKDLEKRAWDRSGPLRDCSICRTFANGAITALAGTPEEEQKCIRREVTRAIEREADHCLRGKIPRFTGVPTIPDMEESSFSHRDEVLDSISDYIWIYSRLAYCRERKRSRAIETEACMKSPFVGYLKQHCKLLTECNTKIAPECVEDLKNLKVGTCSCIEEARVDLKNRISGISEGIRSAINSDSRGAPAIGETRSKVDKCVESIRSNMKTAANDWVDVIDKALAACLSKKEVGGYRLEMGSLLNVGCRKIIGDTTGTAHIQLKTGFDFITRLIDAMVHRSGRFCGGPHCFNQI
ncbi:hypothetical protein AB6A40_001615 [Gnathostoma spinigerum]|uniref:Uncharacterized protein n=1 Tax=Gnathostoma spinigerum TaxID=75299 RepID=A0ABD6EBY7_9BILA